MIKGIILELKPLAIKADNIYLKDLPFEIDEVTDEEFKECAKIVAQEIVDKYVNGDSEPDISSGECSSKKV